MPPPRIPSLLSRLRNPRSFKLPSYLQTSEPVDPKYPHFKAPTPLGIVVRLAQAFLALHLAIRYLFDIGSTQGISMMPTIPHSYGKAHPRILISKLHRRGRNIKTGDVVIYSHPMISGSQGCKRVIGMPGDYVSVMTPGKRESELGDEDVIGGEVRDEVFKVPEGHCWLAGDNLEWSRDSRVFGPVPLALLKGKVIALIWPWSEARWFEGGIADAKEFEHEIVVKN